MILGPSDNKYISDEAQQFIFKCYFNYLLVIYFFILPDWFENIWSEHGVIS